MYYLAGCPARKYTRSTHVVALRESRREEAQDGGGEGEEGVVAGHVVTYHALVQQVLYHILRQVSDKILFTGMFGISSRQHFNFVIVPN